MIKGTDYGEIPGTSKDTLLKPGAEKLTTFFGLTVKFVDEHTIEDFDKPLFFYRRKCQLWRGDHQIAEASGSCNSMEDRYAWRWVEPYMVPDDLDKSKLKQRVSTIGCFGWQYDKRESSGKYGKPESYWNQFDNAEKAGITKKTMKVQPWNQKEEVYLEVETAVYRVPNPDIYTLVNTILKMAEKRALVAATLIGCNASEFFTQDMEDIADAGFAEDVIDVIPTPSKSESKTESEPKTDRLNSSDTQEVINEAIQLADKGKFPLTQWVTFCKVIGLEKDASKIKKDFKDDINAAVLYLVKMYQDNQLEQGYVPPSKDDMPF